MSSNELKVRVKILADGSALIGETKRSRQEMNTLRDEFKKTAKSSHSFGQSLIGIIVGLDKLSGAIEGLSMIASAINIARPFMADEDAAARLEAQLGLTTQAAQNYVDIAREVYGSGLGDTIGEAADTVGNAARRFSEFGEIGRAELQSIVENAHTFQATFGEKVDKPLSAAQSLMEHLGLNFVQAFDFITKGMQDGLNRGGDFLEVIQEYAGQFANAGASAEQFYSVMQTGAQNSQVLGADKIADLVKETRVRINEMSDDTREGLAKIGIDADAMAQKLSDNSLSAMDAFTQIAEAISGIDDPMVRMQAGAAVLGTMYEDLGDSVVAGLDVAATSMADMAGAMESLNAVNETASMRLSAAWRTASQNAIDSFGPAIEFTLDKFADLLETGAEVLGDLDSLGLWLAASLHESFMTIGFAGEIAWEAVKFTGAQAMGVIRGTAAATAGAVAKGWAYIASALQAPMAFIEKTWANLMAYLTGHLSRWVGSVAGVVGALDFVPGIDKAAAGLRRFEASLKSTSSSFANTQNKFTQGYEQRAAAIDEWVVAQMAAAHSHDTLSERVSRQNQQHSTAVGQVREGYEGLLQDMIGATGSAGKLALQGQAASESVGNLGGHGNGVNTLGGALDNAANSAKRVGQSAKQAVSEIQRLWESLAKREATVGMDEVAKKGWELAESMQETGLYSEEQIEAQREIYEARLRTVEAAEDEAKAQQRLVEQSERKLEKLEQEIEYLQITDEQLREREKFLDGFTDADRERAAQLYEQREALEAQNDALREQEKLWGEISQVGMDFLNGMLDGTTSWREGLRGLAGDLTSLAAQQRNQAGMAQMGSWFGVGPSNANPAAGGGMNLGSMNLGQLGGSLLGGLEKAGFGELAGAMQGIGDNIQSSFGGLSANLGGIGALDALSLGTSLLSGDLQGGLGTIGGMVGSAFGGPIGGMIGNFAGNALGGMFFGGGETRSGAAYAWNTDRDVHKVHGPSGGEIAGDKVRQAIDLNLARTNEILKAFSDSQIAYFHGALESSDKGRGGVYSGGGLTTGQNFGELWDNWEADTSRTLSSEEAFDAFILDLEQSTIQALQAAVNKPEWLENLLVDIDPESMSSEEIQNLLNTISALDAAIAEMGKLGISSEHITDAMIEGAGGLDTLATSTKAYFELFHTESERGEQEFSHLTQTLGGAFDKLGVAMPKTEKEFTDLVESLDKSDADAQRLYGSLMVLSPAMAQWLVLNEEYGEQLDELADPAKIAADNIALFKEHLEAIPESIQAGDLASAWYDTVGQIQTAIENKAIDPEEAGTVAGNLFAQNVMQQVQGAMMSAIVNSVMQAMMSGVVQPSLAAASQEMTIGVQSATLSSSITEGGAKDAADELRAAGNDAATQLGAGADAVAEQRDALVNDLVSRMDAMSEIMQDEKFQDSMSKIIKPIQDIGQSMWDFTTGMNGSFSSMMASHDIVVPSFEKATEAQKATATTAAETADSINESVNEVADSLAEFRDKLREFAAGNATEQEQLAELIEQFQLMGEVSVSSQEDVSGLAETIARFSDEQMTDYAAQVGVSLEDLETGVMQWLGILRKQVESMNSLRGSLSEFELGLEGDPLKLYQISELFSDVDLSIIDFSGSAKDVAKSLNALDDTRLKQIATETGISLGELEQYALDYLNHLREREQGWSAFQSSMDTRTAVDALEAEMAGLSTAWLAGAIDAEELRTQIENLPLKQAQYYADLLGVSLDDLQSHLGVVVDEVQRLDDAFADFRKTVSQYSSSFASPEQQLSARYGITPGAIDSSQFADWVLGLNDAQLVGYADEYGVTVEQLLEDALTLLDLSEAQKEAAQSFTESLYDTGAALQKTVDDLLLSEQSTLTTIEKLAEAQRQYDELYDRATAGDAETANELPAAAQALLALGQETYASSEKYKTLFDSVTADLETLGVRYQAASEDENVAALFMDASQMSADQISEHLLSIQDTYQMGTEQIVETLKSGWFGLNDEQKSGVFTDLTGNSGGFTDNQITAAITDALTSGMSVETLMPHVKWAMDSYGISREQMTRATGISEGQYQAFANEYGLAGGITDEQINAAISSALESGLAVEDVANQVHTAMGEHHISARQVARSMGLSHADYKAIAEQYNLPQLGDGGIVKRETFALLGERGAQEVVAPLDKFDNGELVQLIREQLAVMRELLNELERIRIQSQEQGEDMIATTEKQMERLSLNLSQQITALME